MLTTLRQGATGIDVLVLQAQLNLAITSGVPLVIDSIFGPLTLRRVLDFQRSGRLAIDGIVGPRTWEALSLVRGPANGRSVPVTCGNGDPANQGRAFAFATGLANGSLPVVGTRSAVSGFAAAAPLGLTPLVGSRFEADARAVYGASLDYGNIFLSSQTGAQNRPFTVAVPMPGRPGSFIQLLNLGANPSKDTVTHELGHAWQSQHHARPAQFMANCVACQAAALAANVKIALFDLTVAVHRDFPANHPMSAYAYRPGANVDTYAGEQIAQQIEKGEAPVRTHVAGVGVNAIDPKNTKSLDGLNIKMEDTRSPGVKV